MLEVEHGGPVVGKVFAERASSAGGDLRQIVLWIHSNVETDIYKGQPSDRSRVIKATSYAF